MEKSQNMYKNTTHTTHESIAHGQQKCAGSVAALRPVELNGSTAPTNKGREGRTPGLHALVVKPGSLYASCLVLVLRYIGNDWHKKLRER